VRFHLLITAGISNRETAARSLYSIMTSRPLSAGFEKKVIHSKGLSGSETRFVCWFE
jgi:hypothetical protein